MWNKKILLVGIFTMTFHLAECRAMTQTLKAMTFNLWGQDNYDRLQSVVMKFKSDPSIQPDFIFGCEVVNYDPQGTWSTASFLGDLIGYETAHYDELSINSRYPLSSIQYLALKDVKGDLSQNYYQRYVLTAVAEVPGWGKVRLLSVHYAHDGSDFPLPHERNTELRKKQFSETVDWVSQLEKENPTDFIILGGDFNAEPEWEDMRYMKNTLSSRLKMIDINGAEKTWRPMGKGKSLLDPTLRLDYIFYANQTGRDITALPEKILWREKIPTTHRVKSQIGWSALYPSDHLAVLHTYELSNNQDKISTLQ